MSTFQIRDLPEDVREPLALCAENARYAALTRHHAADTTSQGGRPRDFLTNLDTPTE